MRAELSGTLQRCKVKGRCKRSLNNALINSQHKKTINNIDNWRIRNGALLFIHGVNIAVFAFRLYSSIVIFVFEQLYWLTYVRFFFDLIVISLVSPCIIMDRSCARCAHAPAPLFIASFQSCTFSLSVPRRPLSPIIFSSGEVKARAERQRPGTARGKCRWSLNGTS